MFSEQEKELIDMARYVLKDGVNRLKSRVSLLPSNKHNRAERAALQGAKDSISDLLINEIGGLRHETASLILLDNQGRLITVERMPDGKAGEVEMRPRLIAKAVIEHGASFIVLAHNHPSGECAPSRQDQQFTRMIEQFLAAMECTLVDHLIVTVGEISSMFGKW